MNLKRWSIGVTRTRTSLPSSAPYHTHTLSLSPPEVRPRLAVTTSSFSDLQRRLYAAQAARKVDFAAAAEPVKFRPQEVQVSGCWLLSLLYRGAVTQQAEASSLWVSPWLALRFPRVPAALSRMSMYVWVGSKGEVWMDWPCFFWQHIMYN